MKIARLFGWSSLPATGAVPATLLTGFLLAATGGCVVTTPASSTGASETVTGADVGAQTGTRTAADDLTGPRRIPGLHDMSVADSGLDAASLQTEMLYFADRFLAAVAETMDRGASRAGTAEGRVSLQQIKVAYVTSAIIIASEPEPLKVLREYLVFLELATMLWASGGDPGVPPDIAADVHRTLLSLQSQLRSIALLALSRDAIGTIRELAEEWRRDNPDRAYIAFVRFSDLGSPEARQQVAAEIRSGGLLAPVRAAVREAEELRLVSERAIFIANHMPILIEWQAELFLSRTLATPEVQSLIEDSAAFSTAATNLGGDLTGLLAEVSRERSAAIDHLALTLARERRATLDDFSSRINASSARFQAGLEESAEVLLPLSTQVSAATADVRRVMELLTDMQGDSDGESMDLADLAGALEGLTALSGSLGSLATALNGLVAAEGSADTLARINRMLQAQEQRVFLYAAVLVLLIAICVVVVVTVLRSTALRGSARSGI
jgi:hypothetical protein